MGFRPQAAAPLGCLSLWVSSAHPLWAKCLLARQHAMVDNVSTRLNDSRTLGLIGTEQDRDCQRYHTFYAQERDVVRLVRYNVLTLP